jgi:16S rRNA (guanine966-N2)-methyltransferase
MQTMRVIAGSAKGRPLQGPTRRDTRPTGDKVKAALFSVLEAMAYKRGFVRYVDDSDIERFAAAQAWPRVLDLYAGSGALGIEALSRGADSAVFVETDRRACNLIRANLAITGLSEKALIKAMTADQAVSTLAGRYDLILADPPYAERGAIQTLGRLAASSLVGESSILVWEHRSDMPPPATLGPLHLGRTRRHGIAAVSVFEHVSAGAESEGAQSEQV